MTEIFHEWLYVGEKAAIEKLKKLSMRERHRMVAEAQSFADWLALENSREINK